MAAAGRRVSLAAGRAADWAGGATAAANEVLAVGSAGVAKARGNQPALNLFAKGGLPTAWGERQGEGPSVVPPLQLSYLQLGGGLVSSGTGGTGALRLDSTQGGLAQGRAVVRGVSAEDGGTKEQHVDEDEISIHGAESASAVNFLEAARLNSEAAREVAELRAHASENAVIRLREEVSRLKSQARPAHRTSRIECN